MAKNIFNSLKFVFQRVFVLYLFAFLISLWFIDYGELKRKIDAATLNRFRPASFVYLLEYDPKKETPDQKKIRQYVKYFETSSQVFDRLPEAFGLLGFCYDRQGRAAKSEQAFSRAVELEPNYFWFKYNLGMIYYRRGEYQKAAALFNSALAVDIGQNFIFITSSKLYFPLLQDFKFDFQKIKDRLKEGYGYAMVAMLDCYDHLGQYALISEAAEFAISRGFNFLAEDYFYAGMSAYHLRQYAKAVSMLKECLKISPKHAGAARFLGLAVEALGDKKASVNLLNKAQYLENVFGPGRIDPRDFNLQIF